MARISLAESVSPIEVDLFGRLYNTVPVTRSVQRAAVELEKSRGEVLNEEDADADKVVEYLSLVLDLRLKPAAGGRKPASQVIQEAWQEDKLEVSAIVDLVTELSGAAVPQ